MKKKQFRRRRRRRTSLSLVPSHHLFPSSFFPFVPRSSSFFFSLSLSLSLSLFLLMYASSPSASVLIDVRMIFSIETKLIEIF